MLGWLVGWLVGWLLGWLVAWLVGCRSDGSLVGWRLGQFGLTQFGSIRTIMLVDLQVWLLGQFWWICKCPCGFASLVVRTILVDLLVLIRTILVDLQVWLLGQFG